jgi:D-hydroxyproline dehydrogenase subunit gamma
MKTVEVSINGRTVQVAEGTSVAAAVLQAGQVVFRRSISGQPRGPLCGMGICFECRVTVDAVRHVRSCLLTCRSGMRVVTDDGT